MRLLTLTVGRNETERYLRPFLRHLSGFANGSFFYDDQSTDGTPLFANWEGLTVVDRPNEVPTFLEHEGAFREAAWDAFRDHMAPTEEDWVLVIDCDEIFVGSGLDFTAPVAYDLAIPEVWGIAEESCPYVRVDALWGTIHAPRLFRFRNEDWGYTQAMGTPAVPSYVMANLANWVPCTTAWLLHYGYADIDDRVAKYKRYSERGGHSSTHVDSIVHTATLEQWSGPYLKTMRRSWKALES